MRAYRLSLASISLLLAFSLSFLHAITAPHSLFGDVLLYFITWCCTAVVIVQAMRYIKAEKLGAGNVPK